MHEPEERLEPPPQDGQVAVYISANYLEAEMSLTPPLYGGAPVTLEQALTALAQAKVVYGIDQQAAANLVESAAGLPGGRESRRVKVAEGTPPVNGNDGTLVLSDLLQTPAGYPSLREDGTADFFQLNTVRNVKPGTILVSRTAPSQGTPGKDVMGRTLPALDGREVRLRAGKGAALAPDSNAISAALEGHAAIAKSGEVTVTPIFTVAEDVDFSTGNIDFVGTVVVRGDIKQGFTVKAGQSVEVHGGILGGTVTAGGDVTVRYGIIGAGKGKVTAGGKVQCRFMEGAEVDAGGDLLVADAVLHSHVSAKGKVQVTGGRGCVLGGLVRARETVICKVAGSASGVPTEIQVGLSPDDRAEMEELRRELKRIDERMRRTLQNITFLKRMAEVDPGNFSAVNRLALEQALRSHEELKQEQAGMQQRLIVLDEESAAARAGTVAAWDTVYPGVRIVIGIEHYPVIDLYHRSRFFLSDEGVIISAPA